MTIGSNEPFAIEPLAIEPFAPEPFAPEPLAPEPFAPEPFAPEATVNPGARDPLLQLRGAPTSVDITKHRRTRKFATGYPPIDRYRPYLVAGAAAYATPSGVRLPSELYNSQLVV
jgi:hypothetical protein